VFARADRPFTRGTLPMLVGMAAIFSAVGDEKRCYTAGAPRLNEWGWPESGPSAKNMRG